MSKFGLSDVFRTWIKMVRFSWPTGSRKTESLIWVCTSRSALAMDVWTAAQPPSEVSKRRVALKMKSVTARVSRRKLGIVVVYMMSTPSAGMGEQRMRGGVGSDDTQRSGQRQREREVRQDGHTLTVPKSRRTSIPARNGSGRIRSTFECQKRQDASIPLLEKRARRRGRALLYPPGIGRSCVFTVGETICRARELPAITRSGYCISQETRHRVT